MLSQLLGAVWVKACLTRLCLILLSFASTRAKAVNSLPITTPEESIKCKERQILGRIDSFALEEKRGAENVHHLGFEPRSDRCDRAMQKSTPDPDLA
jgi:hypothetical protein